MSMFGKLHRLFQADVLPEHVAHEWANAHFAESRRDIARHVALAISSILCVPLGSVRPETDLLNDLKADEKWEWDMMILHIEESMGRRLTNDSKFTGRTVLDLVDHIATDITRK